VDPTKFDFYAMDCYRRVAGTLVNENIYQAATTSTEPNAETET
jgi:hypothetical protein